MHFWLLEEHDFLKDIYSPLWQKNVSIMVRSNYSHMEKLSTFAQDSALWHEHND